MKSTNRRIKKERKTWSGKKKVNSWKNFSIMDYTGRYIYVYVGLAKNDREMFASLPLYLQHGYWFSDGEFIAADGGFEGDGPVRASFKNPGADANK
jgi:DDE superfamily endonuclease